MSRYIEEDRYTGKNRITLDDPNKCAWMYNEVCCCSTSDYVADYPSEYNCKNCRYYKQETMKPKKAKIVSIYD